MRDVSSISSTSVKLLRKTVTMSNAEFVRWHQDRYALVFFISLDQARSFIHSGAH
jgi:precorrin-6B methylase 1